MTASIHDTGIKPTGGPLRQVEMPDIFGGDDKKTRPATITILKGVDETYAFFRDFSHLPLFMKHLSQVVKLGAKSYRWTIQPKDGSKSEWETEITQDTPSRVIAWETRAGSPFEMKGAVTFEAAPGQRGTIVSLKLAYSGTMGKITGSAEKLLGAFQYFENGGDPDTNAAISLHALKSHLETGEVPTIDGQPSGREEKKGEQDESAVLAG